MASSLPPGKTPPPDPSRAVELQAVERIRGQVLGRIAAQSTAVHKTLAAGDEGWEPFIDGIAIRVLHEDSGVLSYLLRLSPGAVLPGHRHPMNEECLVMEGELTIGDALTVSAGGYHLALAGSLHAPITSRDGAVIFLRGACPEVSHGI